MLKTVARLFVTFLYALQATLVTGAFEWGVAGDVLFGNAWLRGHHAKLIGFAEALGSRYLFAVVSASRLFLRC